MSSSSTIKPGITESELMQTLDGKIPHIIYNQDEQVFVQAADLFMSWS